MTKGQFKWQKWCKNFFALSCFFLTSLIIIFGSCFTNLAVTNSVVEQLPLPQVHPLPPSLAQWHNTSGDNYFQQIEPTIAGYLIWSELPIKVYLDQPTNPQDISASNQRFRQWTEAVKQGMEEWDRYLPLVIVEESKLANIIIKRSHPPMNVSWDRETGRFKLPRASTAQTQYEFYLNSIPRLGDQLSHRCTIYLSPSQSQAYTLATARHEFGHALGIWGHSEQQTDVMYFSQVRNPPPISARDINTLKKVYQQPTSLGWKLK